jgi:putative DNA primase/helicase
LWAYNEGVWQPDGDRTLRHAAARTLGKMNYGANVLSEMKAQARADPTVEIDADDMGLDSGKIAVENGLVDLQTAAEDGDALDDLTPEDYALTQLPVEYDPNADYDEWNEYVEEWAENGRADALQEYVGYCLHVGDLPIHRALLLVGTGANGKGTFLSVVRELLGADNTTSVELQTLANERDAVAEFYGALANIDDDLSSRKLGNGIGMFKKMVAGDRVRGRKLYEDGFEFEAVGKHLYAANEVPQVNVPDEDEAFWRRWLLVEFPNHYPPEQRDPTLRDRLTEPDNLSGVLNWAIDGWARLMEQGYFTGEDRHAHQKRERWQAWGESVDKFISECVENDPDADRMTTSQAHQRYAAWCRLNDLDPVGQRKFTGELKDENVGYKSSIRVDGSPTRGYAELGLADEVPAVENTPEREPDENATAIDEFDESDDAEEADDEGDDVGWSAAREKIADLTEPGDELEPEDLTDRSDDPLTYWTTALEQLAASDEVEKVVADGDQYRRE